jgi:hypothetical protein
MRIGLRTFARPTCWTNSQSEGEPVDVDIIRLVGSDFMEWFWDMWLQDYFEKNYVHPIALEN